MNVKDHAREAKSRFTGSRFNQDAGKGDCAGCDWAFFRRTAAESTVITSPIGKGSRNVMSELKRGFSYISLYLFSC